MLLNLRYALFLMLFLIRCFFFMKKNCSFFFAFLSFLYEFLGLKCKKMHRGYKSKKNPNKCAFFFSIFDIFCMNFEIEKYFQLFFAFLLFFEFLLFLHFCLFFGFLLFILPKFWGRWCKKKSKGVYSVFPNVHFQNFDKKVMYLRGIL